MESSALPRESAYYYPEPYWLAREGGWIKNVLLFFDEIAILLPEYMYGRHVVADPTLAEPLEERGLLRVLTPEAFIDAEMAQQITGVVATLLNEGAFNDVPEASDLVALSRSRMGYGVAPELAREVMAKLQELGLARASVDGVSVAMRRDVRSAFLLLIAQLARETGGRQGLDLHPVTIGLRASHAFQALLELQPMPSRGQVVAFDLGVVAPQLDDIPLDDVLDFKRESAGAHRKYMQNLRSFTLELGAMGEADRVRALNDRRAELEEEAHALRKRGLEAWRNPKDAAGFGLGIAGASWSAATGSLVPAALAGIGAALKMVPGKKTGNAYSYLFDARRKLK